MGKTNAEKMKEWGEKQKMKGRAKSKWHYSKRKQNKIQDVKQKGATLETEGAGEFKCSLEHSCW